MDPDLVVFSHLRWTSVWQRPQHLVSRIGRGSSHLVCGGALVGGRLRDGRDPDALRPHRGDPLRQPHQHPGVPGHGPARGVDPPRRVVASFSRVVDLQDDAADACRRVLGHDLSERDGKLRPLLHANHWDTIAAAMGQLLGTSTGGADLKVSA